MNVIASELTTDLSMEMAVSGGAVGPSDVIDFVFTVVQAFADSKQLLFMETSAKADTNVKQLFDAIGKKMKDSVTPTRSQAIVLLQNPYPSMQPISHCPC